MLWIKRENNYPQVMKISRTPISSSDLLSLRKGLPSKQYKVHPIPL